MEISYLYTKTRANFGKHCAFSAGEARILKSVPSTSDTEEERDKYILKQPDTTNLDTTPDMSWSEANSERLEKKTSSMRHSEGGWPKDVDSTEQGDVQRFRKKTEKDDEYKASVKSIGPIIDQCLKQNNTIDIYEEYFDGAVVDHSSEPPSAKGLAVFRDPNKIKRTATSINWHPEGPTKIAVSYSIMNFQDSRFMSTRMPVSSYIWDTTNPNTPEMELQPASPLCCLRFNPKSSDTLVGGSYNGLISFFDLRKNGVAQTAALPYETSVIENSHHDPVYDVFWISSKTGNQCASVSTDGQMMWWDTRRLGEPTDTLQLYGKDNQLLGGSSMEYNTEAGPTKYLVGTEQGIVLSINLRNRKQNNGVTVYDTGAGKHHGPIYSIQRNPIHNKFFMTIGDWTARVWTEDLKNPIMTTKYHSSYLTSGCWSPTRAGVFLVTRMDGMVDIWDYYYRQNEVAYSHKVGEAGLSSISVEGSQQKGGGRLVAVGDVNGTVSLLELCESLAVPQSNEKVAISGMLDRETKREKNLEIQERDKRKKKAAFEAEKSREQNGQKDGKDERMEDLLRTVDADFLAMIKEAEDDESKAVDETMGDKE